jgi:hypothetical protein
MPSYVGLDPDGVIRFGSAAVNLGVNVHSLKLRLRKNAPIAELGGVLPADAAISLITEATSRALRQLQSEHVLPGSAHLLEIATNVGCTPAFDLERRVLLREVCRRSGLTVDLVNLVEEPVGAALEIIRGGATDTGRMLIIDLGGGTLDVAVISVSAGVDQFDLHATGGTGLGDDGRTMLGGDRFTAVIEDRLKLELAGRRGLALGDLRLPPEDQTALWNRAENAKINLSTIPTVRVALPGEAPETGTVELSAVWFRDAARPLVDQMVGFVEGVYRHARLTLDRSVVDGDVINLSLATDGPSHLDTVCLVGGASQMPFVREGFRRIFGDRVVEQEFLGSDVIETVVLGLARHDDLDRIDYRYPNWGIEGVFRAGASEANVVLFEPYSPTLELTYFGPGEQYRKVVDIPPGFQGGFVEVNFVPIVRRSGIKWPQTRLPRDAKSLRITIDYFGRVRLWADDVPLFWSNGEPAYPTPFEHERPAAPPPEPPAPPVLCVHGAERGLCRYVRCPHHAGGGVDMDAN